MKKKAELRIGTRGSMLAQVQAELVADIIRRRYPDRVIRTICIKTRGDKMTRVPVSAVGGKGIFVKELEEALLTGDIDMAVHSMKDVPIDLPPGLSIGAVLKREDPRDVLISRNNEKLDDLMPGFRMGTGSMRRTMQLRRLFPLMNVVQLRGNLDTRLRKVREGELDGVIVAAAGMIRMGWSRIISEYISEKVILPSGGQGIIGVEVRENDPATGAVVSFMNHEDTAVEMEAERAFLRGIGGGCLVPVAVRALKKEDGLVVRGLVGCVDGTVFIQDELRGSSFEGERLGNDLAKLIVSRGGRDILDLARVV